MAHPEREILFRTVEDLVLSKLEGFRQGDKVSQSEWRDVLGIPWVQGHVLDWEHLRRWATKLGIADLREQAREALASESESTPVGL